MSYEANETAAINAENKKDWDSAYYYWNECLSYVKRYDSSNKAKIEYLEMKLRDCKNRR